MSKIRNIPIIVTKKELNVVNKELQKNKESKNPIEKFYEWLK